jgi:hypothetical protein
MDTLEDVTAPISSAPEEIPFEEEDEVADTNSAPVQGTIYARGVDDGDEDPFAGF